MTNHLRFVLIVLLGIALLGLPASGLRDTATAAGRDTLGKDLDTLLADPSLRGAEVGLVVRDADTGAVLYTRESDDLLLPASNAKLITSAAALNLLGPDYRFTTSVLVDGTRAGPVLDGSLYLSGMGDPTMLAADYDALAAKVAASGITMVSGQLVADDTWFDDTRLAPGWAWDDEPYYYDAQVSALTVSPDTDYDPGSVNVTVTPTGPGAPPSVTVDPPSGYLTVVNSATTGPAGSAFTETVDRDHGANVLRITGSIPADAAPDVETMAVWNPTAFVAALFRTALIRHGVRVLGATAYRATPANAIHLVDRQSMPLRQLLVPFLKLSNNLHAETLTKAMGRKLYGQGSWDAGVRAIDTTLAGFGLNASDLRLVDGSGLSRMDDVTPDELSDLLLAAAREPWFTTWYNALPIAGVSDRMVGGTLRNRMRGTAAANNMHAKTGSLTGVSALSGYVTAEDGEKLVFSMVSNNFLGDEPTNIEDAVGVRLADYQGEQDQSRTLVPGATVRPEHVSGPRTQLECSWIRSC